MKWLLLSIPLFYSTLSSAALNCEVVAARAALAEVAQLGAEQPVSVTLSSLSQVNVSTRLLETGQELKAAQYMAIVALKTVTATKTVELRVTSTFDVEKCAIKEAVIVRVE